MSVTFIDSFSILRRGRKLHSLQALTKNKNYWGIKQSYKKTPINTGRSLTAIMYVWQWKSRHISTVSNTKSFLLAGWIEGECCGIFRIVFTVKLLLVSLSVQAWRTTFTLSLKYLIQRHITNYFLWRSVRYLLETEKWIMFKYSVLILHR